MNIVIIDDHPLVRKGLISVLSLNKELKVVGEAADINEAIKIVNLLKPDLVLLDIKLGNENGLDVIEHFNRKGNHQRYLILTSSAHEWDFKQAKDLGAQGYILKEALPEELLFAIQVIAKGKKYYDPGILDEVLNIPYHESLNEELTEREMEVLMALGEGLSNKDIADKLYISVYTVKKHVSQILSKLNLNHRTQAALYAQSKFKKSV